MVPITLPLCVPASRRVKSGEWGKGDVEGSAGILASAPSNSLKEVYVGLIRVQNDARTPGCFTQSKQNKGAVR